MPAPYPPEYDDEPPMDGLAEFDIAVAVCHDCETAIGPDHAEDVGRVIHELHGGHDAAVVGQWTEVEVLDYYFELDPEVRG